jgi:DNA polymerase sigma
MDRPAAYMPTRAPSPAPAQALTATATATPEAAVLHYHSLFVDQPAQFAQCYVANPPFRDAVHACGLALVVPREGAPPTLVRLPQGPPQYYAPPSHIPTPAPALAPVHAPVPATRQQEPAPQQAAAPAVIPAVQRLFDSAAPGHAAAHRHPPTPPLLQRPAQTPLRPEIDPPLQASIAPRWGAIGPRTRAPGLPGLPGPIGATKSSGSSVQGHSTSSQQQKSLSGAQMHQSLHQQKQLQQSQHRIANIGVDATPMLSKLTAEMDALLLQHNADRAFLASNAPSASASAAAAAAAEAETAVAAASTAVSAAPATAESFLHRAAALSNGRQQQTSAASAPETRTDSATTVAAAPNVRGGARPRKQPPTLLTPRPVRVTARVNKPLTSAPLVTRASPHVFELLNRQAWDVFEQIRPEDGESHRRARLLAHMNKVVRSEWPTASIRMFGSGANGLNLRSGDVDMCLMVPPQQAARQKPADGIGRQRDRRQYRSGQLSVMTDKQIMRRMAEMLRRSKMNNVQELFGARVPILKVSDPVSGFQIDLCLNNELVHHNTDLLRAYIGQDPRVRPLCLLVKYWAKRRGINETYRGTLSSYTYVLLIISFLQTRSPPVLPCLQRMESGKHVDSRVVLPEHTVCSADGVECNVYFDHSVTKYDTQNQESMGELFIAFLHYYAFEFDFRRSVACVRLGKSISRLSKKWDEGTVADMTARAEADAESEVDSAEARGDHEPFHRTGSYVPVANPQPPVVQEHDDSEVHGLDDTAHRAALVDIDLLDDDNFPTLGGPPGAAPKRAPAQPVDQAVFRAPWAPPSQKVALSKLPERNQSQWAPTGRTLAAAHNGTNGFAARNGISSAEDAPQFEAETAEEKQSRRQRAIKRKMRLVVQHCFCIEDPFDLTHDLGRSVDYETLGVIRHEFVRAHEILVATGDIHRMLDKWEEVDVGSTDK